MLLWTHISPQDPAEPWQGSNFLPECARGGPPQHFTEAWQSKMWHILGMNPLEHSHQRASASSPGTNWLGYGLPWPAPDLVNEALSALDLLPASCTQASLAGSFPLTMG